MPALEIDSSMEGTTISAVPGVLTSLFFRSGPTGRPPSWFTLRDPSSPLAVYSIDLGSTPRSANGYLGYSLVSFPIPFTSLVLAKCAEGIRFAVEWTPTVSPREAPPSGRRMLAALGLKGQPETPKRPSSRRPVASAPPP